MTSPGAAYYYHGHEYNRYYRGYGYRGVYLNVYAPGYYYAPAFYGWAYNPWAVPIAFGWGWGGNPWYGLLWRLLPALPGLSLGRVLADGLHHLAGSAGRLCSPPGRPPKLPLLQPRQPADRRCSLPKSSR